MWDTDQTRMRGGKELKREREWERERESEEVITMYLYHQENEGIWW